jgi:GMP synthase-like glutamine amidotransferase
MRVLVVKHHDVDSAGFVSDAFEARGASLDMHRLPEDGPLPALDGIDYIVVLGANPSVNDDLPWIAEEIAWLGSASVPILGICFGAQALCVMAGGRVERLPRMEIGWTMAGSAVPDAIPSGPWMEFHGDQCLPPDGVHVLAANDVCVQAFSIGPHLGVQFHPEVDGAQFKRWLDMGCADMAIRAGYDPDDLLAQTIREEPAARARADRLVGTFLSLSAQVDGPGSSNL